MHVIAARTHPPCRPWLERSLRHTEFLTSFSLQASRGWAEHTLSGKGRAQIRCSQVASGSRQGQDTSAASCCTSKGLRDGGGCLSPCALLLPQALLWLTLNRVACVWTQLTFMLLVLSP